MTASRAPPVLEGRGLGLSLGGRTLFEGLNLKINPGELVALIGPSGVGKTSLLRLLGGLSEPTLGEVFVEGLGLSGLSVSGRARLRAERVGFVFQGANLLEYLTVADNVLLPALFQRVSTATRDAAQLALCEVGLSGFGPRRAASLSGGEAQRVALARALVMRPGLLLCDEPTGNLDVVAAARVTELLITSCAALGCAAVVATHDRDLAVRCARVISLPGDAKR